MGTVLHHEQVMLRRNGSNRVHFGRLAEKVHRENPSRPGRNRGFNAVRIDVKRVPINIHEHGLRTEITDGLYRGYEGKRRCDDLIARFDAGARKAR